MQDPFKATYYNTVDQIYHAQWSAMKLGRLELLQRSINKLWPHGHPTRLIHVAGTSGKGSTCRFLELGLSLFGVSGAFVGPHLFDYRERFSICGTPASQEDISEAWENVIKPLCIKVVLENKDHAHSFHEIGILLALVLFEKHKVEYGIIETGVGGRYDQTTALEVVYNILTNVGRDHEHLLGREQWQRALDKAGIARKGIPFFSSERDPFTRHIISAVCQEVQAPVYFIEQSHVEYMNARLADIAKDELPIDSLLTSEHQKWNAALSLEVIKNIFPMTNEKKVLEKFRLVKFLGRFWKIEDGIYIDVAHNPEKIMALAIEIEQKFRDEGKIFVVGISGNRSPAAVLSPLAKFAKCIIVTSASSQGQSPDLVRKEIAAICANIPTPVISDPRQALDIAKSMREREDVIILTGSTYMIDQALNPDPYLRHINATYGWRTSQATEIEGSLHFTLPRPPESR